jgi:hypothetical protein
MEVNRAFFLVPTKEPEKLLNVIHLQKIGAIRSSLAYGERQFLQVLPFTDKWGLDWLSR